jgi:hypothetical protein
MMKAARVVRNAASQEAQGAEAIAAAQQVQELQEVYGILLSWLLQVGLDFLLTSFLALGLG